jgi:hypothetical protein
VQRGPGVITTRAATDKDLEVIVSIAQRTTTRRTALQTALAGLLAAGAASVLPSAAQAAPAPTTAQQPAPVATLDRAEALLLDVERIMVQLDPIDCDDLSMELDRLHEIASASSPAVAAEDWPRNTGDNRASRVWARGHALVHSSIIPRYGALLVAGAEARKAHTDFRAAEAAEAPFVQAYAGAKAADVERYGQVGKDAWYIAWSWALFGHCEECEREAV